MNISYQWLREWINPSITIQELAHQLTMTGLEVDGIVDVSSAFTNVVIGEVLQCEKHPDADRLKVCDVLEGV